MTNDKQTVTCVLRNRSGDHNDNGSRFDDNRLRNHVISRDCVSSKTCSMIKKERRRQSTWISGAFKSFVFSESNKVMW